MAAILVVDDRLNNRELLATVLAYKGHTVLEACDGAEALDMVKASRPDLVISDILMPTMDGYEFVRRLRANPRIAQTAVIFSSAHYLQRESRKLAEACGVSTILTKPCEPDVLLRIVDEALGVPPSVVTPPPVEEFSFEHLQVLTNKLADKNDELRLANLRLAALNELGRRLVLERNPSTLIREYCNAAREIVGSNCAGIGILKDDSLNIDQFWVVGLDEDAEARISSATECKGVIAEVLTRRAPLRLSHPSGDPAALGLAPDYPPVYSILAAPIISSERVYGWLHLVNKMGEPEFSRQEEELITTLAAQLAVAYENARLYDEAKRHAAALEQEMNERKQAEEELSFVASIVESSQDAIFGKTLDGIIVSWNSAAEKIYGYAADEIKGHHASVLAPPDLQDEIPRLIERIKQDESIHQFETVRRRKDGAVIDVALTISPIKNAAGNVIAASSIARDITNLKRDEEERSRLSFQIDRERQRLMSIVANVPGVVWEAWGEPSAATQRIDFVSDHIETMVGYGVEEWLSTPNFWLTIVHPEDREQAARTAAADFAAGKGDNKLEFRWVAKDGRVVWVESNYTVVLDDEGRPIGLRGVNTDITERKQAEQEMARAQRAWPLSPRG